MHYLFLQQLVENLMMQGTQLNFTKFWINLSVPSNTMWSRFLFFLKQWCQATITWLPQLRPIFRSSNHNFFTGVQLLRCWTFYLDLFAQSKLFFTYFFTEKHFCLKSFIFLFDKNQPSSRIILQSCLRWNYFWYNYFKATSTDKIFEKNSSFHVK